MFDEQLLKVLRCPRNHSPLVLAESELVDRLNRAIDAENLANLGGQPLRRLLDGGLIRRESDVLYPIIDGNPVMLPDVGIPLTPLKKSSLAASSHAKD